MRKIINCFSLIVVLTFFLLPAAFAQQAPYWYGTDEGFFQSFSPPYDPFITDATDPAYMPCGDTQSPFAPPYPVTPTLASNYIMNLFGIFAFNNNPDHDFGVTINEPEAWDAYTLLSCMNGCTRSDDLTDTTVYKALLIDNAGNFINGWDDILPFPARMWPGGDITGTATGGPTGVDSYALVRQNWAGVELWRWDLRDIEVEEDDPVPGQFHHDYNLQGSSCGYFAPPLNSRTKTDGKIVALANHWPDQGYAYPKAWVPEGHPARDTSTISNHPLYDDAFYIIDKNDRIKWQWFASNHFAQMGFSDKAKDAIMTIQQPGTAADICPPPPGTTNHICDRSDYLHFNNVNFLGPNKWYDAGDQRFHPDNLIFDSRGANFLAIIAHDDYAGFKKGDIIYRVGPDYAGTPWASLGQIIGLHNAHMIPATLPGGGNILLFDNGGMGGWGPLREDCPGTSNAALRDYTRILEFNPETYEVVWEYTQTNPTYDTGGDGHTYGNERKFFSAFMGGVQRLVNGNTLITEANSGRVFEVTPQGDVVWEYIAGKDISTKPGVPDLVGAAVYRAYKVPKDWAPANGD